MSPRRVAKALAVSGTVALAIILFVTIRVVRHRNAKAGLANRAGVTPGTLFHARNFHWTQMKGDQSQWVLTAKDATYSDDKTRVILQRAHLAMTSKDGKQVELTAPQVTLRLTGNHVSQAAMTGGVVVQYGDFVLSTPSADFSPDNDELQAAGEVKIVGENLTVTGIGLSGRPREQTFQLLRQVNTRIMPRPQDGHPHVS